MIDPSNALASFQKCLRAGTVPLQPGHLDKELFVHLDHPNGRTRLSYVRRKRRVVTAFVEFVQVDPSIGRHASTLVLPCQNATAIRDGPTDVVSAAIAEMQHGLGRIGVNVFYVEAVVSIENKSSRRVAEKTISAVPTSITDSVSGFPAHALNNLLEKAVK